MKRLTSWSIAVALLGGFTVAQKPSVLIEDPSERFLGPDFVQLSTGFVWDRNTVQRIELRGRTFVGGAPSPKVDLRILPLDPASASPPRVLWSGGTLFGEWRGTLSFARSAPGACAVVGTWDGGAFRSVAVLWASKGLDAAAQNDPAPPMMFDRIQELRLIDTPGADGHTPLRAIDLYDPSLIEWGGALHVVATAYGTFRPDGPREEFVWTAPLAGDLSHPAAELGLGKKGVDGCVIAAGVDARVVRSGGEVIVALRAATRILVQGGDNPLYFYHVQEGDAPVQFYRGSDLNRWTLDAELSAGRTARSDYTIALDGETLWFATLTEEPASQIAVHRFDRAEKTWQEWARRPADTELPSSAAPRGRIWLFPHGSTGGALELLYVDPSGELTRRVL